MRGNHDLSFCHNYAYNIIKVLHYFFFRFKNVPARIDTQRHPVQQTQQQQAQAAC